MPILTSTTGDLYKPAIFTTEADFEAVVVELADAIFGASSIYVDVKKRMSGNDIVTIPDGYVIDMADPDEPKLFVIENEIVRHDPFRHIGVQMLKFATSFDDAQTEVRRFLMAAIQENETALARLREGCEQSTHRNVDAYMDAAVYGPFRALVVIDEARPELHKVLERIRADISVLELKAFESDDGQRLYEVDTLYDEDDVPAIVVSPSKKAKSKSELRAMRRSRRAKSDTIVVPARKDGFDEEFLGKHQWYQIRIGAAMKDKLRYIAAYQAAPISAVTHIAAIREIRPYKDTGKYIVLFDGPAEALGPVPIGDTKNAPQGPVYVRRDDLVDAARLEDALVLD